MALSEMGTRRSFEPLPVTLIYCSSRNRSDSFSDTNSLTRRPQQNSTSMMALLRCPSHLERSIDDSRMSTSSVDNTSGRCSPICGDSSSSDGSSSRKPSRAINLNNDRTPHSTLHCDTAPMPMSWSVAAKSSKSDSSSETKSKPLSSQ